MHQPEVTFQLDFFLIHMERLNGRVVFTASSIVGSKQVWKVVSWTGPAHITWDWDITWHIGLTFCEMFVWQNFSLHPLCTSS